MFFQFLFTTINFKFIVVPFGTVNRIVPVQGGNIGYRDYFIFGIRIARLQQTTPWK